MYVLGMAMSVLAMYVLGMGMYVLGMGIHVGCVCLGLEIGLISNWLTAYYYLSCHVKTWRHQVCTNQLCVHPVLLAIAKIIHKKLKPKLCIKSPWSYHSPDVWNTIGMWVCFVSKLLFAFCGVLLILKLQPSDLHLFFNSKIQSAAKFMWRFGFRISTE